MQSKIQFLGREKKSLNRPNCPVFPQTLFKLWVVYKFPLTYMQQMGMTKLLNSLVILHVMQKIKKYQYCAGNHSERHLPEKNVHKKKALCNNHFEGNWNHQPLCMSCVWDCQPMKPPLSSLFLLPLRIFHFVTCRPTAPGSALSCRSPTRQLFQGRKWLFHAAQCTSVIAVTPIPSGHRQWKKKIERRKNPSQILCSRSHRLPFLNLSWDRTSFSH